MRSSPIKDNAPRKRLLAALSTGGLLALALPSLPMGFLAWFALVPLFIALESTESKREGFLLGFLAGLVFYTAAIHWIAWNSGANLPEKIGSGVGLVLLLSVSMGLLTFAQSLVLRSFGRSAHLLAPLLWGAYEVIWHHGEMAFPWPMIFLTQGDYLPIIQLAAVGGSVLISAVVVLANGVVAAGRERRVTGVIVLLLAGGVAGFGALRGSVVEQASGMGTLARIGLVQGNIDAAKKWDLGAEYSLNVYHPLTVSLMQDKPDLVVWPETAAPVYIQQDWRWRQYMQDLADSTGFGIATGGRYADFSAQGRVPYNPSFLIEPGDNGRFNRYSKVHLVPFGERVPFQWIIPSLGKLNLGQAEFKPGDSTVVWTVHGAQGDFRAAPLICYEAIFPNLGLAAVRKGAQVMLNMTNDGWYDGTTELRQHLLLSRIRSVETGLPMIRATNTGISAIIGPDGRFLKTLPQGVRGALVADIPLPVSTLFDRGGWVTSYLLFAGGIVAFLLAAFRLFREKRRRKVAEGRT